MPFFAKDLKSHIGKKDYVEVEAWGTQCAAYVKKVTSAPATSNWRVGAKVFNPQNPQCFSHPAIRPGVAIATFDKDGRYPSEDQHAAIFLRYTIRGFMVQDQWKSKGEVTEREIFRSNPNEKKERINDPGAYFVIEAVNMCEGS